MQLTTLDWTLIAAYFALALGVGLWASKQAKTDAAGYFLAGRNMPWWLLGISMVATTFSTDTPNLVTDLVRQQGVAGNWAWWAFLLTGMVTVFVYARLWRRSGVLTDISFYELRYGGKSAAFLRKMVSQASASLKGKTTTDSAVPGASPADECTECGRWAGPSDASTGGI